jgi:predicted transcriptional regulator
MNRKRYFSPAEWEVLQYIAAHHPVTAREAADHFAATRDWARTTVITMLDRLRDKGYLVRDESGAVHRYAPREPQNDMMRSLVRDFVQKALGGSVTPFVAYLGQEADLSPQEAEALRQIVRELDATPSEPDSESKESDDD